MIKIKTYTKNKSTGSSGGGSTVINNTVNNSGGLADQWFEFDNDNNAVRCKFDFYSVGAITANGSAASTNSIGLNAQQISALQQLLSDPDTAAKLQAIAEKTTLTTDGNATEVSIDAQVAQQTNP